MVLEQRHCRLGSPHRLVLGALIILAFICQSFGQPILRSYSTTNLNLNPPSVLWTNNGSFTFTFDPAPNNAVSIDFNQGGLATPQFRIQMNTTGDRLRFFNSGNLMQDLAGSVVIYTNTFINQGNFSVSYTSYLGRAEATNAFRMDPSPSFQDNEYITEARMDAVIAGLAGQSFYLWTNAHPTVAGVRMAADVTTTDQFLTNVLANGSNFIANWLTTNFVIGGVIKAGAYNFHIHGFKTQDAPLVSLGWDLIRTNGSGIVTLGTGDTTSGAFSTDSAYTLHVHLVSDILVSTNDFIGARFYVTKTGGGVNWITHVGGTTDSQLETPSLGVTANVVSQNGGTATNLTILAFENITTTTNTSELPVTNQITFGGFSVAGFGIPYWKTDSSNMFLVQPSFFRNHQFAVFPGSGNPVFWGCGGVNPTGTPYTSGQAGGLYPEDLGFHLGYFSAAASNSTAAVNPLVPMGLGTKPGRAGYLLGFRFAVTNQPIEIGGGGVGFFAGVVVNGGSYNTIVQTTNSSIERMGIHVFGNMGLTNFSWVSVNTAGSETRANIPMNLYPSNTYQFYMYAPPNGRTLGWRLENLNRNEYTNSFETSTLSTNINNPVISICNRTNRQHAFIINWINGIYSLGF